MKKLLGLFTSFLFIFVLAAVTVPNTLAEETEAWTPTINDIGPGGFPIAQNDDGVWGASREQWNGFFPISGIALGFEDGITYHVSDVQVLNTPNRAPGYPSLAMLVTDTYGETFGRNSSFVLLGIDSEGTVIWAENPYVVHDERLFRDSEGNFLGNFGQWNSETEQVEWTTYTGWEADHPEGTTVITVDKPLELNVPEGGYILAFQALERTSNEQLAENGYGFGDLDWSYDQAWAYQSHKYVGTHVDVHNVIATEPVLEGLPTDEYLLYPAGLINDFDPLNIPNPADLTATIKVRANNVQGYNGDVTADVVTYQVKQGDEVLPDGINTDLTGDYTIEYSIAQSSGDPVVKTLRVVIVDFEIFNNADHDLDLSKAQNLARYAVLDPSKVREHFIQNVSAFDAYADETDITGSVVVDYSEVNFNVPGDYTVHYSVTNTEGKDKFSDEQFTIMDDIAPDLYGVKDRQVVQGDLLFNELDGIVAIDQDGTELNTKITNLQDFDLDTPGEYTITVKAMDESGNNTSEDFKITVLAKNHTVADHTDKYYTQAEVDQLLGDKEDNATDFGLIFSIVGIIGVALLGVFSFTKKQ